MRECGHSTRLQRAHGEAQREREPLQGCILGVEFHLLSQDCNGIHCESKFGGKALWPLEDDTDDFWFLSWDRVTFYDKLTLWPKSAENLAL